ncbi:TetR/AcrR family transcriptional regulator [Ramlibacter sp. AN1133]|uniref:TetR/AcrR family transcriptional regulator n=1 Tax=Ramlibacter sp. AN1133 TaxID=3133429 RepID=UPI0030C252F9
MFDTVVKIDIHVKRDSNMGMAGVRQFDEDEVLGAALEVFWARGYGATTMQHLADATGVQRGSLYNAYGGKDQLFLRAYRVYGRRYLDDVRRALASPSLTRSLEAFFAYAVGSMTKGRPARGCLTTKAALDEQLECAEIRAALSELLRELEALLRERLAVPAAGERLRVPVEDAARLLVAMTRGLVVMERVHRQPAELLRAGKALVAALVDEDQESTGSRS